MARVSSWGFALLGTMTACGGPSASPTPLVVPPAAATATPTTTTASAANAPAGTSSATSAAAPPDPGFVCPRNGYGKRCKADEICRIEQRGATVPSCVPNPCADPPSCACAAICGPSATCSAGGPRQFTCAYATLAP